MKRMETPAGKVSPFYINLFFLHLPLIIFHLHST